MLVQVIFKMLPLSLLQMKSFNTLTAILIAAGLMVGVTGCKKTPKNVTTIPRANMTPIGEDAANPRLTGPVTGDRSNPLPNDPNLNSTNLNSRPLTPEELANAANQTSRPNPGDFNEDTTTLAAETVYFDFDRANVKSSEVPKVQRVATYLKNQTGAMIRVEGNCDERGTEEYNRSLGERRALAIRELLIASGVAPDRVTTVTYGEDRPAAGFAPSDWDKHRRGDFVVLTPKTTQ